MSHVISSSVSYWCRTWSHASLERRLVDDIRLDIGVEKTAKALSKLVKKAASSTVERDGGLCLTLLASHPDRAGFTLNILEQCLAEVTGSPRQSLKEAIFDNASIKSLYLTNAGDVHRTGQLTALSECHSSSCLFSAGKARRPSRCGAA